MNKMNIRTQLVAVTISLLSLMLLLIVAEQNENANIENGAEVTKSVIRGLRGKSLPKLFNFDQFVENFDRHYSGILEWMTRRRLYLGRVIRVFVSFINYKRWKSDSYLAVNQFTDRTPKEISMVIMSKKNFEAGLRPREKDGSSILEGKMQPDLDNRDIGSRFGKFQENRRETYHQKGLDMNGPIKSSRIQHNIDQRQSLTLEEVAGINTAVGRVVGKLIPTRGIEVSASAPSLLERIVDFIPQKLAGVVEKLLNLNWLTSASTQKENSIDDEVIIGKSTGSERETTIENPANYVYIDHRESECLLPPGDQGACAACYAFSALAFFEWAHCKATGKLIAFSEQYVVDCGTPEHYLHRCSGGSMVRVADFVQEYGLELQKNYPYIEQDRECPYTDEIPRSQLGYMRVPSPGYITFSAYEIEEYLKHSPVLVGIKLYYNFCEYGGGVDFPSECTDEFGLHAVLIVGSGRQDGQEYWLMRNSFSSEWGDAGHYKLNKRSNCIYLNQGYVLRPQFSSNEDENINRNYNDSLIERRREQYDNIVKELSRKSQDSPKKERKFRR